MSLGEPHQAICEPSLPGVVVRGVAHDYRNRLQTIFAALTLIQTRARSGATSEVLSLASAAQTLLEGAGDLSNNVLSAVCPPHWELRQVEINHALRSLAPMLTGLSVGPVELRIEPGDREMVVLCSPRLLENALINLVMNANDAIEGEGTITVATAIVAAVPIDGEDTGWPVAAVTISDTGRGMSEDVLRRAFVPDVTTKAGDGHSGLGLMMTKLFADQAGGTVRIRSVPGKGTSVTLLLPAVAPASSADAFGGPAMRFSS